MDIKQNQRQNFLQKLWKPYPDFDNQAKEWGRVVSVNQSPAPVIAIQSYRPECFFKNQTFELTNVQDISFWTQILIAGDIVSISKDNLLTLLTPNVSGNAKLPTKDLKSWAYLRLWPEYLRLVRVFFTEKNFLELSTPMLVKHPGSEPTLQPFETQLQQGNKILQRYLPTSPELTLKKILTSGVPNIFEITKSFRNNENTERHSPEFWILEWYRNFSNLNEIKQDVKDLIVYLQSHLSEFIIKQKLDFLELEPVPVFSEQSFAKIFQEHYSFSFSVGTSFQQLKDFCAKEQINYHGIDSIEDLFSVITMEKIETQLDTNKVAFLENYPPYAAALARKDAEGWAQRFEVYWKGLELANAFYELNDPQEQRERFEQDNQLKIKYGMKPLSVDEEFLTKLNEGLPPSAGIALGLERLFMALLGIENIHSIYAYTTQD